MNIQQQNGIVSTIHFIPYAETEEYQGLRKSLFDLAMKESKISPINHIDLFDETFMIFENYQHALSFLIQVFRAAVTLGQESHVKINLRSSVCEGSYFVHQDQIYGDAINLATRLSYTSRENELRVCNIDKQIIDDFINSQGDLACFIRDHDESCVSIALLDNDSTNARIRNQVLEVEYNFQSKTFEASRNRKLNIGRSNSADIYIVGEHISRSHATITLQYGKIFIEDHSANGTYIYIDDREIFLNNDSMPLDDTGFISCGLDRESNPKSSDVVAFHIQEVSPTTRKKN